jgi:hypothetical protein
VPGKFICHTTNYFNVYCIMHSDIQTRYPKCNCWSWGDGVFGSLFLKSSVLPGDFTKIFFSLSTEFSKFG